MPAFFVAFLTCFLAVLPGREAVLLARMSGRGAPIAMLAIGWVTAALASLLAAWLAGFVAPVLHGDAKLMLVAFALAIGGAELLVRRPGKVPREPTRSLGAAGIVLLAGQVGDSARFLVFALAAYFLAPLNITLGATLGCGVAFTLAWLAGAAWEERLPLRTMRLVLGIALVFAGLCAGFAARGVIG